MSDAFVTVFSLVIVAVIIFLIVKVIRGIIRKITTPLGKGYIHYSKDYYLNSDIGFRIKDWLGKSKKDIIVFDTETTGLKPAEGAELVTISAIRFSRKGSTLTETNRYKRFYYPKNGFNSGAEKVNGLSKSVIKQLREGVKYPKYFKKDIKSFYKFCKGTNLFVAHNIEFDAKFVELPKNSRQFCTMSNTMKHGRYQKLVVVAENYDIAVDEEELHDSMYDTEICSLVFQRLLEENL